MGDPTNARIGPMPPVAFIARRGRPLVAYPLSALAHPVAVGRVTNK